MLELSQSCVEYIRCITQLYFRAERLDSGGIPHANPDPEGRRWQRVAEIRRPTCSIVPLEH